MQKSKKGRGGGARLPRWEMQLEKGSLGSRASDKINISIDTMQ